ncbi:hypothetical protein BP00DRAFT_35032 [Aspergillus indologenus CBS 114.80]|uniref:Uncharacterized protein n=1 Tax=Aspergillus indologenus CBS 114.80 TaxID=1450541 RepID=A0A2V5HZM6_9EURO|nr:hypothetical protein BP00DRAFT_35032 [Aspergillus indologenus CBS 114.80]
MNLRKMNSYPSSWGFVAVAIIFTTVTLVAASYNYTLDLFHRVWLLLELIPYHFYWLELRAQLRIHRLWRRIDRRALLVQQKTWTLCLNC